VKTYKRINYDGNYYPITAVWREIDETLPGCMNLVLKETLKSTLTTARKQHKTFYD
jgi:hypothetical protein